MNLNKNEIEYWKEICSNCKSDEIFDAMYYLNENYDESKELTEDNRLYFTYPLHVYLAKICKTEEFKKTIKTITNYIYDKRIEENKLDPFVEFLIFLVKSGISYHWNRV